MSNIKDLARPEIRDLRPYRPAQFKTGLLRLNANETPWRPAGDDSADGLNWYPQARPLRLTNALASHYRIGPEQLLVTRGSSEGIDLLMRCFCRPGEDRIVICPPTFGMYEVYAQLIRHVRGLRATPERRCRATASRCATRLHTRPRGH